MSHKHVLADPECPLCRTAFCEALLSDSSSNNRELPWRREDRSIYELVLAEMLLQKTRAEHVARLFETIMSRCCTWEELAAIPVNELEELLRPLGLHQRRAAVLHELALSICSRGALPVTAAELEELPGIGPYIARAVAAQIHGEQVAPIDVNIARILERVFGPRELADIRDDPYLQRLAASLVPVNDPGGYLIALLDFAAAICRARSPRCTTCPVPRCRYAVENQTR